MIFDIINLLLVVYDFIDSLFFTYCRSKVVHKQNFGEGYLRHSCGLFTPIRNFIRTESFSVFAGKAFANND